MPVPRAGTVVDNCVVYGDQETVFKYLATFSNTSEWDPGCLQGKPVTRDKELGLGSKFWLQTEFKGNKDELVYEIVEYDAPNKVVLQGESPTVRVRDTIILSQDGDNRTKVNYTAEIKLKGWMKPFIFFLGGALNDLGKKAMAGMEATITKEKIASLSSPAQSQQQE